MFSFFKKRNLVTDISWLGVDIHSHILPGIDDGAKNMGQSLSYIRQMTELGFERLIFTPHIFKELYPNTQDTILPVLENVKAELDNEDIRIQIGAAAEYMLDYDFAAGDSLLCLPNNHLLIEMSYLSETPNIEDVIFDLQIKGYKLVLAHPERYNFYHNNLQRYTRLHEMGCIFQMNLLSIVGYYGPEVRNASKYLLQKNMYDLAGSDLHHDKHMALLKSNIQNGVLYNLIGSYPFLNKEIFI